MREYKPKRSSYIGIVPEGKKYCPICQDILDNDLFRTSSGVIRSYCRDCQATYGRERYTNEQGRRRNLKRLYDITPEEYQAMFLAQGSVCAVCRQPETAINPKTRMIQNLHIDHNHATGEVRALLCQDCNTAFGHLREDPERIRLLLEYALKWKIKMTD